MSSSARPLPSQRTSSTLATGTGASTGSPRRTLSSLSASTALSHSLGMSSIDSIKPAVILEIGASLTKCGFAGEMTPRAVVRTSLLDSSSLAVDSGFLHQSGEPRVRQLTQFFRHLFYNHLLVLPRERRIVIVESPLSSSALRSDIARALLQNLDVPSICFVPAPLMATLPFNANTAFVIDVGFTETLCMPVVEGVTLLNQYDVSEKASKSVMERIGELLRKHGKIVTANGERREINDEDWDVIKEQNMLEDILVKYTFCTSMSRAAQIIGEGKSPEELVPATKEALLPLKNEYLAVPPIVRETACEVLFEGSGMDADCSLPQMIFKSILRCPIDVRRTLFQSVLFCGGTTLIKGFYSRVKEELVELARESNAKCAEEIQFITFTNRNMELMLTWTGDDGIPYLGCLLGALQDVLAVRSVSRECWLENGKLPDWTDFVANPTLMTGARAA